MMTQNEPTIVVEVLDNGTDRYHGDCSYHYADGGVLIVHGIQAGRAGSGPQWYTYAQGQWETVRAQVAPDR